MAYEGGYTSALNSQQSRDQSALQMKAMLQQLAQQKWLQDQQEQDRQQKLQAQAQAGQVLSQLPAQRGPQSPPPGQPSQPMMMPPQSPPMQPPPQAMAPGMGGGTQSLFAPPTGMPPGMPPGAGGAPQPPMPQGWKPSPVASAALGGGAPGAPPQGQPPAGAAPGGMPPPPQGGMAPPGMQPPGAPGAQQPGVIPPQLLSVPNAIEMMKQKGIPPEKMIQVLDQMMPAINASNKEAFDQLRAETAAQAAAAKVYQATIAEFKATEQTRHNEAMEGVAGRRADTADKRADATAAHLARLGAGGGGGGAGGLHDDAIDLAAAQYLKDGKLPPMYRNQAGREKIMNRAAEMQRAEGGDVGDVAANRAGFKADQGSLNFQQKRVDAIEGSMKKINKDITTLDSVLDKNAFTDAKVVNTPINKLRRAMSDPGLAQLDLAAQQVGTEYERLLTSGMMSVAQLHAGAAEDAKKLINGDMSPAEVRAKVKIMRREMDNAKSAATEQLGEIKTRMKGGKAPATESAGSIPAGWTVKEH